ncbi:MAG TPA: hypothetical protein VE173_02870, partial [Longimicrobiales bacterium]|nr:hypothetical protein [Longimicrobiales bacterium]
MDAHLPGIGSSSLRAMLLALALVPFQARPGSAQETDRDGTPEAVLATEDYLTPPQPIMDAVLAPRYRNVTLRNLDPSGRWFLHTVEGG